MAQVKEAAKLPDHFHAFHDCKGHDAKDQEHEVRTLIDVCVIQKSPTQDWHACTIHGIT
jgi:hypothetical protein